MLPRLPVLAPGVQVVRLDDHHLQVGLAPTRLVLPDSAPVRELLDDLAAGRSPSPGPHYAELVARSLVVEGAGPRRAPAQVVVDADDVCRPGVLRLLAAAGLDPAPRSGAGDPAALRLVLRAGTEPGPEDLDPLVRDGVPHLLLTGLGGSLVVGPLVAPGLTACLRCLAAHRCERDPGDATVRAQYRRAAPATPDPALLSLGLAWVVRDALTWAEGGLPRTWSATVRLEPDLELVRDEWSRHPACGCCWGDTLAVA